MRTLIIGCLLLLAWGGTAAAFDCQHPKNPAVAVVCSDPELIRLIDQRKRAWEEARGRVKGKERSALYADQRRWLREYPQSCGVAAAGEPPATVDKSAQECFKRANSERIAYLRAAGVSEAPAPEAAKPPEPAPPTETAKSPETRPAAAAKPAEPVKPDETTKPPEATKPPETAKPAKAAAASTAEARWHLKFTFACQTPDKLAKVLGALGNNDIGYALSQTDCLPVPEGRDAILLSVAGKLAKIRLCSSDAGCTDVYADAAMVLDPAGKPVGK